MVAARGLLKACILRPPRHNEAMPCVEARTRGKGPKVCGRRNLVKWALKGQNSHRVGSIEPEMSVLPEVEREMGLPGSESQVCWCQGIFQLWTLFL